MRRVSITLLMLAAAVAAVLVVAQHPFAPSAFEFQQYRQYSGVLETWPYPVFIENGRSYLLAAAGKHGFDAGEFAGRRVSFHGALIHRPEGYMLEVLTGSMKSRGTAPPLAAPVSLGEVTLTGEVVDTKCFLGVMNPGSGKVHRACAARCISGGLPPALLARDATGETRLVVLTGRDNRKLNRELLPFAGEHVTARGELLRAATGLVLKSEPRDFHRE